MTPSQFWEHTREEGDCQVWTLCRDAAGYGRANVGGSTTEGAHRIAYRLAVGPIPYRMLVCHSCDNPPCVYPPHLFLGTSADNNLDKARKGRAGSCGSRLTLDQAIQIETQVQRLGIRPRRAAASFGVSTRTIYRILDGSWRPAYVGAAA